MTETNNQNTPEVQAAPNITPGPSGKAIASLVCGILSLICCGFFAGIPAIIVGKMELDAIKKGQSAKEGYTITQVGFILGIVGTVLTCLATLVYLAIIVVALVAGNAQNLTS